MGKVITGTNKAIIIFVSFLNSETFIVDVHFVKSEQEDMCFHISCSEENIYLLVLRQLNESFAEMTLAEIYDELIRDGYEIFTIEER